MTKIIKTKCNEDDFKYVRAIRDNVFIGEQGIAAAEESDEYDSDESTDFFVLFEDDKAVATARAAYMPFGVKLGRIAVLGVCRGKHYGAKIVSYAVEELFKNGAPCVHLESQCHAVGFYEKLGFTVCGEELVDRGILHLPMIITPDTFRGEKL